MTSSPRPNRCDTVIALIDECLAEMELTSAARSTRPIRNHRRDQEALP